MHVALHDGFSTYPLASFIFEIVDREKLMVIPSALHVGNRSFYLSVRRGPAEIAIQNNQFSLERSKNFRLIPLFSLSKDVKFWDSF